MKTREQIIHGMCIAYDHSYGILDDDTLRAIMEGIFDIEIAPLLGTSDPPKNTVRVKIAVAVDENRNWSACGDSKFDEAGMVCIAKNHLDAADDVSESIHFVTADVPIPESRTVEGRVEMT